MFQASGLVPARFLTLIAHLVLTMALLLAREDNVMACLPFDYTEEQKQRKVGSTSKVECAFTTLTLQLKFVT